MVAAIGFPHGRWTWLFVMVEKQICENMKYYSISHWKCKFAIFEWNFTQSVLLLWRRKKLSLTTHWRHKWQCQNNVQTPDLILKLRNQLILKVTSSLVFGHHTRETCLKTIHVSLAGSTGLNKETINRPSGWNTKWQFPDKCQIISSHNHERKPLAPGSKCSWSGKFAK
jgi:hypothetical protein